jgi:serine/threonine protein kinase
MTWRVGDLLEGNYRVDRIFNGGGMGIVHQARHLAWEIDVAIKHPRPELLSTAEQRCAFERECATWSEIGLHSYVATCFYTRELGGIPCVVAEFVEGGSLRDWIDSKRLYSGEDEAVVARILQIATATAWGLAQAHDANLIHCDMKPGNVLMTADGMAKVTDFGLAKVCHGEGGSAIGAGLTAAYASPEQTRGEAITRAADVWSWAVSVLEMFMGGIQWQRGAAAGAVLDDFGERRRKAVGLPAMPRAVFDLLARCFNNRPSERPSSFTEIAEEVREIYEDEFGESCDADRPDLELLAADSFNNRAVCLLDSGQMAKAESLLRQALVLDPYHPEVIFNLAAIYRSRNESSELSAIQNLQTAAAAEPRNSIPMKLLAQILMLVGKREDAGRCFDEAARRAWTAAEKEEIERLRRAGIRGEGGVVFAKPRSGSDFCADLVRFRRLIQKADRAMAEDRDQDAMRYAQMCGDISGFGRHPQLRRTLAQLQGSGRGI